MKSVTTYDRKTGKMIQEEILDNSESPEVWDQLAAVFWEEIQQREGRDADTKEVG
jgi:hypothetical protein